MRVGDSLQRKRPIDDRSDRTVTETVEDKALRFQPLFGKAPHREDPIGVNGQALPQSGQQREDGQLGTQCSTQNYLCDPSEISIE
jgi:hypothetical protein